MNEQIINELLEQLKSNLKNVEAARKQVEEVVSAYDALKGQVNGFVTEFGFITQNTRTMITQLEEIKKRFQENVSTELKKQINDVKKNITSSREEIRRFMIDISGINSSPENSIVSEISDKSRTITTAINTTQGNLTTALKSSESKVLQQIKEKGESIELEIGNSKDSIKNRLNFVIGVSVITLCIVIYILTKM